MKKVTIILMVIQSIFLSNSYASDCTYDISQKWFYKTPTSNVHAPQSVCGLLNLAEPGFIAHNSNAARDCVELVEYMKTRLLEKGYIYQASSENHIQIRHSFYRPTTFSPLTSVFGGYKNARTDIVIDFLNSAGVSEANSRLKFTARSEETGGARPFNTDKIIQAARQAIDDFPPCL